MLPAVFRAFLWNILYVWSTVSNGDYIEAYNQSNYPRQICSRQNLLFVVYWICHPLNRARKKLTTTLFYYKCIKYNFHVIQICGIRKKMKEVELHRIYNAILLFYKLNSRQILFKPFSVNFFVAIATIRALPYLHYSHCLHYLHQKYTYIFLVNKLKYDAI